MVSGTNPLMGSAAIQNGLRGGRLFGSGALKGVRRSKAFGTDPEPSSSSSSERSSSSAAAIPPDPRTSISPRSLVTIGVAPKLGAAGAPAPKLGAAGRAELGPVVEAVRRRSEFLEGSPSENECDAIASTASRSFSVSPRAPTTSAAPGPAVPSRLTPSTPCSTSPSMRASACARCAASPSAGPHAKCAASVSSLNDPTVFLSRRFRASGSVSTNRQSSGSSRPSRRYSACRNPASNCRALCAARITGAPPPARLASVTYSSRSSAARANDGTAGALTMLLVIPVSCVMGGGILNRPGLISVAIGACVGSVTFTAAISMIRFLSLLRPVVSRSNAITMGVSDDRAFAAVADEDALGAMAGMRSSLTGVPPLWGVENEDPEDPPASPHAEARFVSVAGAFSRRCAPLFARWRGGAAAGGFADAGGATPAAPPREPPRDAPRRARAGTTPNPASVGVGPFRSRPWRRRRPPPRGSPRARRRGRRSLVARARRRSSPAPSPAHRGGCTGTAGSPRTLSFRVRAPLAEFVIEPRAKALRQAGGVGRFRGDRRIRGRGGRGNPSPVRVWRPQRTRHRPTRHRLAARGRMFRGTRVGAVRGQSGIASRRERAARPRDARAAPQRGEPRASKGVHVTRSGCDGRCARRHLSEPSARLTE